MLKTLLGVGLCGLAAAVPSLRENRLSSAMGIERLCSKSSPGMCPHALMWARLPGEDIDAKPFSFNIDYEKTTVNGAPAVTTPFVTLWAAKGATSFNAALWSVADADKPTWRMYIPSVAGVPTTLQCKTYMRGTNDMYQTGKAPIRGWCADKDDDYCYCIPVKGWTSDGKAFTSVLRMFVPEAMRTEVSDKVKKILTERAQCFTDSYGKVAAKPMCEDKVASAADLKATKCLG